MNNLLEVKQSTIKSTELVDIINEFRRAEGNENSLQHYDFMKKIRKEIETLKNLGLEGQGNFSESSYINSQNKEQPCFQLNRDGMLQMLNSESTFVRFKTIEYINKLEETVKQVQAPQLKVLKDKEIEAKYNNSLSRKANALLKIANNPNLSKEYVQVLQAKAAEILTEQRLLPLPIAERKTLSAEELGKVLGISANRVGRIANEHNLKTEQYGKLFHDKSRYSSKEVESFRYYEEVIPILRNLI